MREIKFRLWHKKYKIMSVILDCFQHYPMNFDVVFMAPEGRGDLPKGAISFNRSEIDVMQYTGLKDKNGKEIYEGDIVEVLEKGVHYIAEVSYARSGFFMMLRVAIPTFGRIHFSPENDSNIDQGVKVIGNIYENPELL